MDVRSGCQGCLCCGLCSAQWPRRVRAAALLAVPSAPRHEGGRAPDAQLDEWTEAFAADAEGRKVGAAAAAAGDGWTVVARKGVQPQPAPCLCSLLLGINP